jgi:asparagine synthase (glutamine-hydrolysing)
MCGIAGLTGSFSRDSGLETVARMNAAMEHRGPDDEGAWAAHGFAFGMRRLSIIDLAGGAQPMHTARGTGVVFNGEIYNYRALRSELQSAGCDFKTHSDTEVIPHLYETGGVAALEKMEGMFALCLHDPAARRLVLMRDRFGIKPLYYAEHGGRFLFASEIKALLAAMPGRPQINKRALHHYLTLRYTPGPETIWQGIFKLEPGRFLEYSLEDKSYKITKYWELCFQSEPVAPARDYVREFEGLFLHSVHKQLEAADVPVGVMLSGGLDSACVSAAAVEMGHRNFHTFSVAFRDGGAFSELPFARELAAHTGSQHHEVEIGQKEFLEFLPSFVKFSDEPLADLASVPLHYVSRLAREHVKVALTGEGSDELLAGYSFELLASHVDILRTLDARVPAPLLKAAAALLPKGRGEALRRLAQHGISGYLKSKKTHMTDYWTEEEKRALWAGQGASESTGELIASWYDAAHSDQPLDQMQQVHCRSWLVEDLLMKADKMSMATSLELRVPFLEHPIGEWAARLPMEWKVGSRKLGYSSKRILREFAKTRVPESIINRPKQGFPVPAYEWLKGDLGAWAEDILFRNNAFLKSLFDLSPARPVLNAARAGNELAAHKIWILIILEHWGREWIAKS